LADAHDHAVVRVLSAMTATMDAGTRGQVAGDAVT
jgi:hypothetical protein